jgi:Mn2+/Fe2+ NRAMP family transporter
MAEAFRLLVPIPFALVVVATAVVILLLEVFVSCDRYSLILRWLALSIFAYVLELFVVNVDWSQVLAGLIPSFQPTLASTEALVAIFGTTISPYLFVWQAGEEVEEHKAHGMGRIDARQIRAMRVESAERRVRTNAARPQRSSVARVGTTARVVGAPLVAGSRRRVAVSNP